MVCKYLKLFYWKYMIRNSALKYIRSINCGLGSTLVWQRFLCTVGADTRNVDGVAFEPTVVLELKSGATHRETGVKRVYCPTSP
jgi:hypothetical protein